MLCAHCDHPIKPRHAFSFRLDGGINCPACGAIVYMRFAKRRDPAQTFVLLAAVAVFAVLLYFAGQFGGRTPFIGAMALGFLLYLALYAIFWVRAIDRSYTVSSYPPQELQRRKRHQIGLLISMGCSVVTIAMVCLEADPIYILLSTIAGLVASVFANWKLRPLEQ